VGSGEKPSADVGAGVVVDRSGDVAVAVEEKARADVVYGSVLGNVGGDEGGDGEGVGAGAGTAVGVGVGMGGGERDGVHAREGTGGVGTGPGAGAGVAENVDTRGGVGTENRETETENPYPTGSLKTMGDPLPLVPRA